MMDNNGGKCNVITWQEVYKDHGSEMMSENSPRGTPYIMIICHGRRRKGRNSREWRESGETGRINLKRRQNKGENHHQALYLWVGGKHMKRTWIFGNFSKNFPDVTRTSIMRHAMMQAAWSDSDIQRMHQWKSRNGDRNYLWTSHWWDDNKRPSIAESGGRSCTTQPPSYNRIALTQWKPHWRR